MGLGYIGLPTAAVLARSGHRVIGVDVNAQVVDTVNQGLIHIVEPDLDQVVSDAVASGALSAQLTPASADVFLIAVPTPFRSGTGGIPQPNIDFVLAAARAVAPVLRPGNLVLLESCRWAQPSRWPRRLQSFWFEHRSVSHRLLSRARVARTRPSGAGE